MRYGYFFILVHFVVVCHFITLIGSYYVRYTLISYFNKEAGSKGFKNVKEAFMMKFFAKLVNGLSLGTGGKYANNCPGSFIRASLFLKGPIIYCSFKCGI